MRGLSWRWASDAATLRVWSGGEGVGQDVEVTLRAESPRRYFDAAPKVVLRAGGQTLATLTPEDDFELTARVPAAALQASGGILTLTDRSRVRARRSAPRQQRSAAAGAAHLRRQRDARGREIAITLATSSNEFC